MRGTVKFFSDAKGYGFIKRDDGQGDVFVHYTGIIGAGHKSLAEKDSVEFEIEASAKGPKAVAVTKL